jgi:PAS domain S-box-containing protein
VEKNYLAAMNAFNAVMAVDDHGHIISWNPGAEAVFGWSRNEALGRNFYETIFPDHTHGPTGNNENLHKHVEQIALHRSGRMFPVELYLSSADDNGGEAFIAFAREITDFRGKEELIRHADENQRVINSILHTSLEPISLENKLKHALDHILSLRDGKLLSAGAIYLKKYDTDVFEMKVQHGLDEEQRALSAEIPIGSYNYGLPQEKQCVERITDLHEIQFHDLVPHGHYWIPILSGKNIFGIIALYTRKGHKRKSGDEEFLKTIANSLAVAIERDSMEKEHTSLVDDLKSMITDLKNEKKYTESIIQSLNSGLLVLDHDGKIITCNSKGMRILSHFVQTIEGEHLSSIFGKKDAEIITKSNKAFSLKGLEVALETKNGEERTLGIKAASREDASGKKVGRILSFIDITEMNYFRQEIEKMNRLSTVAEIASAVAHEVRNPLAGIKTMSQSIEENIDDDDDNKEYIKRIIKQVDRLNQLLSEFFTYARPGEPKKVRTSLVDIINDTKPLIQSKLDKKNIKLSEHYQKGLPHIFVDQNQIQQVFLNLMLNSIDALEHKGAIEIQADRLRQEERKNYIKVFPALRKDCEYIVVHFKDNGIGMTPEVAEKVFEPFFTTKHNGSGLGLSIVYRILKENNAAIYVDCAESGTTAFKMFLEADE